MNKDNLIRISTLLSQDTIDQVKQEAARNSIKPATLMRQIIVRHFEKQDGNLTGIDFGDMVNEMARRSNA